MTYPHGGAAQIWRDGDGGVYQPKKPETRDWAKHVEETLDAAQSAISSGLFSFATLADLAAATPPVTVMRLRTDEYAAGAGVLSGGVWARQAAEPNLPATAKAQDADGVWWALEATAGRIRPEQFGAISKTVIEAETRTWFNAMAIAPKSEQLLAMDWLVRSLKYAHLWENIGALWVLCGHNYTDSMINVKTPGTGDLSEVTPMGFLAGGGFDCSAGALATTAYDLNSVPGYGLDDASMGAYMLGRDDLDNSPAFGVDGAADAYIVPRRGDSNVMRVRLNGTSGIDFGCADGSGHFMVSREDSANISGYIRGQDFDSAVAASTSIPIGAIKVGNVTGGQSAGTIAFAHAGKSLNAFQVRTLAFIFDEYQARIAGVWNKGIDVADLDAVIGLNANTTALNDAMIYSGAMNATVIMAPATYLANDTIQIGDHVTIEGIVGRSRIRSHASMTNKKATAQIGKSGEVTINPRVSGLIFDYNPLRWEYEVGGVSEASDGDALAWVNGQGGWLCDVEGWAPFRHGVNGVSETFNRSGADGSFNQPHRLVSRNFMFQNVSGFGFGDDGVTFHGCLDFRWDNIGGAFGRATFAGTNSQGVEVDDLCSGYIGGYTWARFASGVEIKGHGDAMPAKRGVIGTVHLRDCARVNVRHVNRFAPDDAGSPSGAVPIADADLTIKTLWIENPIEFVSEAGSVTADLFHIYGLKGVRIDSVLMVAGKGVRQVPDVTGKVFYGAEDVHFTRFETRGFNQTNDGLSFRSTATGQHTIGMYIVKDGPTDKALFAGSDAGLSITIGGYSIRGAGAIGIFGYGDRVKVGPGSATGYAAELSLSN